MLKLVEFLSVMNSVNSRQILGLFLSVAHIEGEVGDAEVVDFFGILCPRLRNLDRGRVSFPPDLLSRWKLLENVTLELRPVVNLDSVFCGIHPEEVEELKGKGKACWKPVQMVPIRAPITHLTG